MKIYVLIIVVFIIFLPYGLCAQTTQLEWVKQIGGPSDERKAVMTVDNSGNVYTVGSFYGEIDFDPGIGIYNLSSENGSAFILKLDASGNFIWAKQFASNNPKAIVILGTNIDEAGNLYFIGDFVETMDFNPGVEEFNLTPSGMIDMCIAKLNPSGEFIWAKQFGGKIDGGFGTLKSFSVMAGSIYTAGSFVTTFDFNPGLNEFLLTSSGTSDAFITKLDTNGEFVWAKHFGGEYDDGIVSIAIDNFENVYSTGYFSFEADFDPGLDTFIIKSGTHSRKLFISKLDSSGNFIWTKQLIGNYATKIAVDSLGDIIIAGSKDEIFIQKFDISGDSVWTKYFGEDLNCSPNSMTIDYLGNIYTTGVFSGTVDFDPGAEKFELTAVGYNAFISKLSPLGNFLWAKQIGKVPDTYNNSTIVDNLGNVYTEGSFIETVDFDPESGFFNLTSRGYSDIFIQKLSHTSTGITENSFKELASAPFPNPSTGKIFIENPFKTNDQKVFISIYTMEGSLLKEYDISLQDNLHIDLSKEQSGLYAIKLVAGTEVFVTKVSIVK